MVGLSQADRAKKAEYLEILDETIRTNPYRKAASAMASVMAKHGIPSNTLNVLGRRKVRTPEKRCALTKSLHLAQNCYFKLTNVKDDLQALCSQLTNSTLPTESTSELAGKATMAGHLLTLIGEAETIAKRIYETAVGLHVAEDFLREPEDLKLLDFSTTGRIQIPNYNFNHASQLCLEWLYSTAYKWLRGFQEEVLEEDNAKFISIFETFTKSVKDYTEAVCFANQVFRVLLYPNDIGKKSLQEYVLALGHVMKNDVIMEIQALRRTFDSIQNCLERIGWAASIAWMKYSGKSITVETLNESGIQVDHSIFQYKFYEGPPKSRKVFAQKRGTLKKVNIVPSRASVHNSVAASRAVSTRASQKSIKSQGQHKNDGEISKIDIEEKDSEELKFEMEANAASPSIVPSDELPPLTPPPQENVNLKRPKSAVSERHSNVSNQMKHKKLVRKKSRKPFMPVPMPPMNIVDSQKSLVLESGNEEEIWNMLRNQSMSSVHSKGDSKSKKVVKVGRTPNNNGDEDPQQKIPVRMLQHFDAVFGTNAVPVTNQPPRKSRTKKVQKIKSTTNIPSVPPPAATI